MPVDGEESDECSAERRCQECCEVEIVLVAWPDGEDVRVDEEHGARDERNTGDQPVEAVYEVDGVHHEDDREHREGERHRRRQQNDSAERKTDNLNPRPRHDTGGKDLGAEFDEPVKVIEVVENSDNCHEGNRYAHPEDGNGVDKHPIKCWKS